MSFKLLRYFFRILDLNFCYLKFLQCLLKHNTIFLSLLGPRHHPEPLEGRGRHSAAPGHVQEHPAGDRPARLLEAGGTGNTTQDELQLDGRKQHQRKPCPECVGSANDAGAEALLERIFRTSQNCQDGSAGGESAK